MATAILVLKFSAHAEFLVFSFMFSLKNMKLLNTNCEAFALDTMKYPRESLLINTVN